MPIQAPQWLDYLICAVCCHEFNAINRMPISLGCGHTICKSCLNNLRGIQCPFDQTCITDKSVDYLPVNSALLELVGISAIDFRLTNQTIISNFFDSQFDRLTYLKCMEKMDFLALFLRQTRSLSCNSNTLIKNSLTKPIQRKLLMLINCQLLDIEGRQRLARTVRFLGERVISELIMLHQNSQLLMSNLWTAIRSRGCQFLGPAIQEDVLKLILTALDDGSALSRKVLVMFIVQRLEPIFPQASKTSVGHVVQLLYRASCFNLIKREGESSLMKLKEDYTTYESLRRVHDMQIIQIANEAGLRIVPEQWSSLLYGDITHKSEMQSIIDKLQTPQSFVQSIQEFIVLLQRNGDPTGLSKLRPHFELLVALHPNQGDCDLNTCLNLIEGVHIMIKGLIDFSLMTKNRRVFDTNYSVMKYKVTMCRDFLMSGICPRGNNCTFAHSSDEIDMYSKKFPKYIPPNIYKLGKNSFLNKSTDLHLVNSITLDTRTQIKTCETIPNFYSTHDLNPILYSPNCKPSGYEPMVSPSSSVGSLSYPSQYIYETHQNCTNTQTSRVLWYGEDTLDQNHNEWADLRNQQPLKEETVYYDKGILNDLDEERKLDQMISTSWNEIRKNLNKKDTNQQQSTQKKSEIFDTNVQFKWYEEFMK